MLLLYWDNVTLLGYRNKRWFGGKVDLEIVDAFCIDELVDLLVVFEPGTARNHMAHDQIGLDVEEVVCLAFACRFR